MIDKKDEEKKEEKQSNTYDTFDNWKPLKLGGLKLGAKDWTSEEIFDEMLEEKYKYLK